MTLPAIHLYVHMSMYKEKRMAMRRLHRPSHAVGEVHLAGIHLPWERDPKLTCPKISQESPHKGWWYD